MSFLVQLRVMFHAVPHCTPEDSHRFDVTVSLGDDHPVEAPGISVAGCTMILRGLGDGLYLLRTEPPFEILVFADNPAGGKVMHFPAVHQTGVVERRRRKKHALVHVIVSGHIHSLLDHLPDVILPMSPVKGSVARNDLALNVLHQFLIEHIHFSISHFRLLCLL